MDGQIIKGYAVCCNFLKVVKIVDEQILEDSFPILWHRWLDLTESMEESAKCADVKFYPVTNKKELLKLVLDDEWQALASCIACKNCYRFLAETLKTENGNEIFLSHFTDKKDPQDRIIWHRKIKQLI